MASDDTASERVVQAVGRRGYNLSAREAREQTARLIAERRWSADESRYMCVVLGPESPFVDLGRYVETTVFFEAFGNRPDLMAAEYQPYEAASEFYLVVDRSACGPIGVMRIIKDSPSGLKSLQDLARVPAGFTGDDVIEAYGMDMRRCVDIASLAVVSEHRGAQDRYIPSRLMYRTLFLLVLDNPAFDWVVTIIDRKAERALSTLKFPFRPLLDSGYFPYLDSGASRALIAKTADFRPVLTAWVERLRRAPRGSTKARLADLINSLITETDLDTMLAFER
jgi:hypothetical protein